MLTAYHNQNHSLVVVLSPCAVTFSLNANKASDITTTVVLIHLSISVE